MPQLLLSGVATGSVYALIGLSLVITHKATRVLNFAQGEMAMATAVFAYVLVAHLHMNYAVAMILTLLTAAIFGFLVERLIIRPAGSSSLVVVGVLTLGLYYLVDFVVLKIWPFAAAVQRFPPMFERTMLDVGGVALSSAELAAIVAAVLLMLTLAAFYRFTRLGIAMRAAADNRTGAALMGIDMGQVSSLAWSIAAVIGGVSGVLLASLFFIDISFVALAFVMGMSAAVVGGFESMIGVAVGGVVVGVSQTLFGAFVSTDLKNIFIFSLIIVILVLRPEGLLTHAVRARA